MNTVHMMQQVENSTSRQICQTYRYLFEDEIEQVDTMDEVCRQYKIGKFEPMVHSHRPSVKRHKAI